MISRPQPVQQIPRPYLPQEDLLTKAAPWIAAVPLVVMVGAIVVPAIAVAAIGVFVAAILRLRWWGLVIMAVIATVVVVSLGINPINRVEKVMDRTRGAWMDPKADTSTDLNIGKKKRARKKPGLSMIDRLVKRAPSLAKTGLPASIPVGLLVAAAIMALTQGERSIQVATGSVLQGRKKIVPSQGGGLRRPPRRSEGGRF